MTGGARILVVDDETPIRRFLRVSLEADGPSVIEAATARAGIDAAALENPAAVILDLGLPDADGITVLRAIREWSQVPVLVLSVRADGVGKVAALDAGAQDYVVKPFGVQELLARLHSLLRHHASQGAPTSVIEIADLVVDAAAYSVEKACMALKLTRKEFYLLWMLASQAGRLVTQAMILRTIWGAAHVEDSQYLRVYIRQLRAKIGDDATTHAIFLPNPVWAIGFVWLKSALIISLLPLRSNSRSPSYTQASFAGTEHLAGGVRYWVDSPEAGPDGWGARLAVTYLFPK